MRNRINVMDYCMDWGLKDHNVTERDTPGTFTREEVIEFLGSVDVGGIELVHAYWDDCDPSYMAKLASDAGVPIRTYVFYSDLAVEPKERQSSVDATRRLIDRSLAMGAKLCMIVPGFIKEGYRVDEQRKWMIEGLSRCAQYAGSCGATLLSENIDYPPVRPFMGRGDQCRDICREVDSPHFRLIYDPGASVHLMQDPMEMLDQMAPYISHMHLKNFAPVKNGTQWKRTLADEAGKLYRGVLLDEGAVDLVPLLRKLRELDYQGDFVVEYQGEEEPREAVRENIAKAKALVAETGFSS